MARRSPRAQTLMKVGIVLAILVLLNIISVRVFGRFDTTQNRLFSLSDASKTLMRSLNDRVTVKAYFTEDLPAPYNDHRRAVLDELNEYKAYAAGNLQYEFIDPAGEKTEQEAQQQGIPPVQVQVVKEDKFEVKKAYMGLLFLYEDRKEVLPVVQNTSSLEYDISSTIKRLTTKVQKKIGFLSGEGEPALTSLSRVKQTLDKQYQVTQVDVAKGKQVPPDIAALIVLAPTAGFSDPVKYQVDQYVMRGGRVAFLLNRVGITLQERYGRPLDLRLDDLLAVYGLRLDADLVRDIQCANITIAQQQFGMSIQSQVPFPYLPIVNDVSKGNAMVKDLQRIVLFFASSIDTANVAARGLQAEILLRSSKQSGRIAGQFVYDPLERYTRAQFTESGIPLAAVVSGEFASAFAGKPVPVDTAAGAMPPAGPTIERSPDTRVILVGDGDFPRDEYMGAPDNLRFFANMVDYLVDDAGLIAIRSKDVAMPPLDQISDGTKKTLKYTDLVLPPLLVVGYGFFRWRMRKARKKILELQ